MAGQEDCASILEQFIYDGANLPAEISHMMEEIEAKDIEMQKHISLIHSKDANLQKNIKANGVLQAHPKEAEYNEQVRKHYDAVFKLQEQKMQLSERAASMLDRQIRKFDIKIRDLASDGQLSMDGLPSSFNRKPDKPFLDTSQGHPLQNASINALNTNSHRLNAQAIAQLQARQLQAAAANNNTSQRSSPITPVAAQAQRQREQSLGADAKRRKLNNSLANPNLPAQPSNLRQSSLGPGTPKASTPTANNTAGSRAGSVPRAMAAATQTNTAPPKKSALSKKVTTGQVPKIRNKHTKHARLTSMVGKKAQSPSGRGGRSGTAASEEDSVLSSADASETDASQTRARGGRKKKQPVKQEAVEEVEVDAADDNNYDEDDPNLYCLCQKQSFGEMVACENEECKYQWFHLGCVKMKKAPADDEIWYCPFCRFKAEITTLTRGDHRPLHIQKKLRKEGYYQKVHEEGPNGRNIGG